MDFTCFYSGNDTCLFGSDLFLFQKGMSLVEIGMFLFETYMFLFVFEDHRFPFGMKCFCSERIFCSNMICLVSKVICLWLGMMCL